MNSNNEDLKGNMLDIKFGSVEEGIEKLKKGISVRDQMGGALYWNVCNDDCLKLAEALKNNGASVALIENILNSRF